MCIGVVGRIGEELLNHLLTDPGYASVQVIVHSPLRAAVPRLVPILVGENAYSAPPAATTALPVAHDVFCCISDTPSYYKTDKAYLPVRENQVLAIAWAAVAAGAQRFVLISPLTAFMQLGHGIALPGREQEAELARLPFDKTIIARPPLAASASMGTSMPARVAGWVIDTLTQYMTPATLHPLRAAAVAKAAVIACQRGAGGFRILGPAELRALSGEPEPAPFWSAGPRREG
ncbi:MAG: hypothetical protein ACREUW_12785 [Burkholderiales bacterium]